MKKINIIILSLTLIMAYISLAAQEKENDQKSCVIKYDVISLLGDQVSTSMGVRLGVEFKLGIDRSFEADIMYVFQCKACEQAYTTIKTEKTVGFLASGEYRFYLFKGINPWSGFHIGPQLAYQYTNSEMAETYDNGIPNTYQVYRNMASAHAMAGYQLKIAGPLYFDPSIGLGVRFISSRNENKLGTNSGQHEYPYNKEFDTGAKWFPSFDIGLKLGLKL